MRYRCSFSNLSVTSPTSQLILQLLRRFTYITARSPTLPLLPYVTAHSPTLLSLLLSQRLFTYVTWRAAHEFIAIICYGFLKFIMHFKNLLCLFCFIALFACLL